MSLIGQHPREQIVEQFARHVSSGKAEFFAQAGVDFIFGKREGVYVWDVDGQRRLIDCHCNGGVYNLGHRHPRVVAALKRALDELDIGNHHFISEHRALLGERLAALSPGDLNRVVFGVGGGEAIDLAIKLARAHTGRSQVISARGGYHGHTGFALAAGEDEFSLPFAPLPPGFSRVPFGDLDALEAAMGDAATAGAAAVLFETIPATLGMPIPPEDYYAGVRTLCDRHGAVMVMDEVQAGLGRCGAMWGIDTYGVVPDIIVTAKGLGGGIYPLSATIYRDHLNPFLHEHPFIHVSTCGGAEVGCYVALEVLAMLEEPAFLAHVQAMAGLFREGLAELQARHPGVLVEVRQRGLMMGLKWASEMCGPLMTVAGFHHGVLTIYANNDQSVSQLLPPLTIQEDEARQVLAALERMTTWLEGMVLGGE
ncbi:MAG: aminotransferase class III-fold pyridoxal phosphate-dependent enzyme [Chloroflexi bacterium]|nr:aminotransferase class III-fold pyridoxal phosphate-dependent enzyme [Chloroflexota bacterium]MBU1748493.1 aminotransferase class III-fold pyridoxal phosphate-dependent enzyme [Chloroflexota bacterium]MBU1879260.1 aminotransferase class III-fold pyridoxal phosphate-dependent enzyme [Chloroflexota bacterium]